MCCEESRDKCLLLNIVCDEYKTNIPLHIHSTCGTQNRKQEPTKESRQPLSCQYTSQATTQSHIPNSNTPHIPTFSHKEISQTAC